MTTEWLNYHHLLYFWMVAREGGLAAAAAQLHLTHPTLHAQVRALEEALGEKLLVKQGRKLVLTETGQLVYGYAEDIFALGRELQDAVRGRPTGKPPRLVVGIADAVPKLVALRLLEPALHAEPGLRLLCREDKPERLLAELALHQVDVVLSDAPVAPGSGVRAFSHLLGESGTTFMAVHRLAASARPGFPLSLGTRPLLLPAPGTALRRGLDTWLDGLALRPLVAGEFDDSALLKVFGQQGHGIFPVPTAIEDQVQAQYSVEVVGRTGEVKERYFALSGERRLKHPAVVAILQGARQELFARAP